MNDLNPFEILVSVLGALFGGVVRELLVVEKDGFKKARFLVGLVVSMFAGYLMFLLCKHLGAPEILTILIVASSGYIGVPIIDQISKKAKDFAGKDD